MQRRSVRVVAALFVLLHVAAVGGELLGQCPGEQTTCPARAAPCRDDDQCGAEERCCDSSCGRVCMEPLYTGCENIRVAAERVARALAAEAGPRGGRRVASGVRTPRCRAADGEFEPVQCDNEIVSSCWCVDGAGFEVAGTRAPAAALVNCSRPAACAAHTCRMLCPLGFELDARGCPLCQCRDPCAGVRCPGSLACQLEETPCLREPCPPVPTCKRGRSLQNICPVGEPLLISETQRPFLCGNDPGKPNCPPLYRCLVDSGNDYGVCCPASLELQKAGTCPAVEAETECGTPCEHDLECPSVQKCCAGGECGRQCAMPHNVTECLQQRLLAELLSVSEIEGRGYVPQCRPDGAFEPRQCSRNQLVCWCVDRAGQKLRGSMGPAAGVSCAERAAAEGRGAARSLAGAGGAGCARALCASVCEYGYRAGADGCATCECDDACAAFPCADREECVLVKDPDCTGELCTGYPVCRPRVTYENPCPSGAPLTNETSGEVVACARDADCPAHHACTPLAAPAAAVARALCCPPPPPPEPFDDADDEEAEAEEDVEAEAEVEVEACPLSADALCGLNGTAACGEGGACAAGLRCCRTDSCGDVCLDTVKTDLQDFDSTPTMCEYLRDFDEKMEGTVDGMRLALPQPACHRNGSYEEKQCAAGDCWCVDSFGTEIPATRGPAAPLADCVRLRTEIECLEVTCRMGCDYGFELNNATRCPACRCRDPCAGVTCAPERACAMVDVACDADYCPPVPACLPRKVGQCPYLVPAGGSCEFACRDDGACGAGERCCPTGCGTACARAAPASACQQRRAHALHAAAERGAPPASLWIPACAAGGDFERVQCRAADATCWCVDAAGVEVAGTRVAGGAAPPCDAPRACPDLTCGADECEMGRALDAAGCPTCACREPCAELVCPAGERCTLAAVECTGEPCPRLALCAPAAAPACPGGAAPLAGPGGGALACGPAAAACPSSHSCRFAPHDTGAPVCCPKPRSVCFEPKDEGRCAEGARGVNATRWYFDRERNRCERFRYGGCSTSPNNFHTLDVCNAVCPVLSRCERLREKNAQAAQRYGQPTFAPACDATGAWEPVQCMQHIDVCWCVSALGEPQKGSLVRGARPDCNFRRARTHLRAAAANSTHSDDVLEELIRQMTALRVSEFEQDDEEMAAREGEGDAAEGEGEEDGGDEDEMAAGSEEHETVAAPPKRALVKNKCLAIQEEEAKKPESERRAVRCREGATGGFTPRQCADRRCWCVDEAGNRLPTPDTFPESDDVDPCEHTRVESVHVVVEWARVLGAAAAERARAALAARLAALGARVPVALERAPAATRLRFTLRQHNKLDLLYHLETLVKEERSRGEGGGGGGGGGEADEARLGADTIRAEYRLAAAPPPPAMQHREILSESTVSAATSYHTALIVLAATSAFIISVLSVLLMLYRAKLARREPPKQHDRFLPYSPPVYVLSADEKADLARVLHSTEAPKV